MGIDLGRFNRKKNEEWLDWLADDPVPAGLRARMRQKAVQDASRPIVRRVGQPNPASSLGTNETSKKEPPVAGHSVSINISIPKLKKPQFKIPKKLPKLPKKLTYKHIGIGASALVAVVSIGIIVTHNKGEKDQPNGTTGVLSAADQKPSFAYNLPTGKGHDISEDEVRFNAQRKVVSFKDSIGGVEITVSQQPLPENLKKNTNEEVKKLAEGFSANEVLSTANPTAYLGTSVKGPQTVIFAKKDLLVFIQSTKSIDKVDWASYITSLQ